MRRHCFSHSAIICAMSVTNARGSHQTSQSTKRLQPAIDKQKSSTAVGSVVKQWTPILQSHHKGYFRHTDQHRDKNPGNGECPKAHTTRHGTTRGRRPELLKSSHQSGRKRQTPGLHGTTPTKGRNGNNPPKPT